MTSLIYSLHVPSTENPPSRSALRASRQLGPNRALQLRPTRQPKPRHRAPALRNGAHVNLSLHHIGMRGRKTPYLGRRRPVAGRRHQSCRRPRQTIVSVPFASSSSLTKRLLLLQDLLSPALLLSGCPSLTNLQLPVRFPSVIDVNMIARA
jgi:hypothetical protein